MTAAAATKSSVRVEQKTASVDKKSETTATLRRLLDYMVGGESRSKAILGTVSRIIALLGLTALPFITGQAMNVISDPNGTTSELYAWVVRGLIAVTVYLVFSFIADRMFGRLATNGLYKLQTKLFKNIQTLSMGFFYKNPPGQLSSNVTNDAEVVSLLGATPVFVDMDPVTYNIDPIQLGLAIEAVRKGDTSLYPIPRDESGNPLRLIPKEIIPVDLFGLPAEYDRIMAIAEEQGLFVLEDAAQGLGGVYKGRQAGGLGHMGTTSFFPAKPLGCYGDGGAIFTDDATLADMLYSLRVHGKGVDKYDNIRIGVNGRLDTMQAAILIPKLKVFPNEIEERQRVAKQYNKAFKDTVLTIPFVPEGLQSVWAQYSLVYDDRGAIQSH